MLLTSLHRWNQRGLETCLPLSMQPPPPVLLGGLRGLRRAPLRSGETQAEYRARSADRQAELKDRGGFVGGTLRKPEMWLEKRIPDWLTRWLGAQI